MRKRWLENKVIESLKTMRVTMLTGSRQCGKTTLADYMSASGFEYRTLDEFPVLKSAHADPQEFIKHAGRTLVIDEIQRAPELIVAIKRAVDKDTRCGQYLITGSADIAALPTVQESLAGRVEKVRLRPFAYGEILGNEPRFLKRLQRKEFCANKFFDKKRSLEIAFNGGFPEPLAKSPAARRKWHRNYVDVLLEKDLRYVANIKRQDILRQLFAVVCEFSARYMDKAHIRSGLAVSRQTLDEYLNVLEKIYLLDRLRPWLKTGYDRVGKQDKIFVTDTGLMSAVLDWKLKGLEFDGDKSGKLLETFVYNQLAAQVDLVTDAALYHYRDNRQREIDFIIEHRGRLTGIEVKASSSVSAGDFKHLRWFRDNIGGAKFYGLVLYTGEQTLPFGRNLRAVPLNNLWE
ncbi:MAG: ATP-binding protein [Candidatus Margulisbacteria bacterium]|jgi:predicted AAA+ superfamily ATPase|nr:ATP-binding protein [Candidatus Margulisiibacteriota bacterium]